MDLEPIIGLEIHVQLKTKSKMFCACPNLFGLGEPNTAICPICMGYPGTLPVPNQTAIEWTQRAGAALNCQLAQHSKFDRKHYFYPDLPKGYQISQYDQPFCVEGGIEIIVGDKTRTIRLERIHLEEDAAKNTHPAGSNYTLVDYNRAGTPLMEIVTKPDIKSPLEAKIFMQELQKITRALDISDADMEKGQMRCDANISLREKGKSQLHPKTEIKNVNSFRFVERALAYEIERQTKIWEESGPPTQLSTRGYDSKQGITYEQRTKEEAADYRYFPEPDIPPFDFSEEDLGKIKMTVPELPLAKQARFIDQLGTTHEQALLLIANNSLANFFEDVVSEIQQLDNDEVTIMPKEVGPLVSLAANFILRYLKNYPPYLGNNQSDQAALLISPANFAELIVLVYQNKINKDSAAKVLTEMQRTGGDPDHIIENLNLAQVSKSADLEQYISAVIQANPDVVAKIVAGKSGAMQYLTGQVMARTQGKANPQDVTRLLKEALEK